MTTEILTGRDVTVRLDETLLCGVTALRIKETVQREPIETFLTDVPVAVLTRPRWEITLTLESEKTAPVTQEHIGTLTVTGNTQTLMFDNCVRSAAETKAAPDGAVLHTVTYATNTRRITNAG